MERDNNYGQSQMDFSERIPDRRTPPNEVAADAWNLQLTTDEMRILKECQYNSVFHRGLPLGAIAVTSFYYLMKQGILRKNKISLVASGITGFLLGTMSYRQICIDKLLALPNGTLKERILIAQGKQSHVRVEVQDGQTQPWIDNAVSTEQAPMTSSLDIEPYQSHRFDDISTRPIDTEAAYAINPPLQPITGTPYTTYDDLRRSNRDEYGRQRNRQNEKTNTTRQQPIDSRSSSYERSSDSISQSSKNDDFLP